MLLRIIAFNVIVQMNNELIGIISNEGELKGVIEDNSFNVIVQITESGARGLPGKRWLYPYKRNRLL